MNSTDKLRSSIPLRYRWLALAACSGLVFTAGCGGTETAEAPVAVAADPAGGAEVAPVPSGGPAPLVSPAQGAALLEQGAILIDVRTPAEYAEIRIDGASLIDISDPAFDARVSELDPARTYVVYCRSGNRSVPATQRMLDLGLTSVYNMGGIIDWVEAGGPTVSG